MARFGRPRKEQTMPPIDMPRLWARYDARRALERLEAEGPRFTHGGRPTPESIEYADEMNMIIRTVRS